MPKKTKANDSELKTGKVAPTFSLQATTGIKINLKEFKGEKNVVVYFYPKDDTPGCTIEAKEFENLKTKFAKNGSVVLGISPNDMDSHNDFCRKNNLTFPLLVDQDAKIARKYGVWKEKEIFGQSFMSVLRTTFVIGKDGKIKKIYSNVKVSGHARNVLAFVKTLN